MSGERADAPRVDFSEDLRRICDLEVRGEEDLEEVGTMLKDTFGRPGNTMTPWRHQVGVLLELYEKGGVLGNIGVGGGKTLITFLAPSLIGAKHPVLFVPGNLKQKTARDFKDLAKSWVAPGGAYGRPSPRNIKVVSYEKISRPGGELVLKGCDLLMCDEADALKRTKTACTRKILKFCRDHEKIPTLFLSGTLVSRSLRDFWHLLRQTHGPESMPLPANEDDLAAWCGAVDEKVSTRVDPGELWRLTGATEPPRVFDMRAARKAVGDRIFRTPGCVRTTSPSCDAEIRIRFENPSPPSVAEPYIEAMYTENVAPTGDECLPMDKYRFVRQLALGFYYAWDPRPPAWWLEPRKAWRRFVRNLLEDEALCLYSEGDVVLAVRQGTIDDGGLLDAWKDVEDDYIPNPVPCWLTLDPIHQVVESVMGLGPSLVWVDHGAVGDKISEIAGWAYYREAGLNSVGEFVDDARTDTPVILSMESNSRGRNLQHWSKNYIVTPSARGSHMEQLLGRTHRAGQKSKHIDVVVRLGHQEIVGHFTQAIRDAKLQQTMSAQKHRLLLADYADAETLPPVLQSEISCL